MSAILTKEIVQRAVDIVRPGVFAEFIEKEEGRMVAAIVVLDPKVSFGSAEHVGILWKGCIGEDDKSEWPEGKEYFRYAGTKARMSWETGLPAHIILNDRSHLLKDHDFKYGGSAVFNGIIVGVSGLKWEHDLATAQMIAACCHALSIERFAEVFKAKPFFVGDSIKALDGPK